MLPSKKYTAADLIEILRKRALLLLVPPFVGLFVALAYSSRLPNVYKAETLIQIVPQKVPDRLVPSTVTIQTEDRIESLGQQVKSRTFLERLILELNLYPHERATRPMQDVVELMRANMELETVRPNRIAPVDAFYVRFKHGDPVLAARATERIGEGYITQNARERGALAEGAKEFLDSQLVEAQKRMEEQDRRLQAFREQNAGKLPSQLDSNRQAIQNYQMQRQTVVSALESDRARRLMLERLYNDAIVSPIPVNQTAQVVPGATPVTMPTRQRLELERATLKQLQQRLTADHPDVKRARRQVEELEKLAASEPPSSESGPATTTGVSAEAAQRRSQISGLQAEIAGLDRQIATKEVDDRRLTGVIAEYQARIEATPAVESQWLALSRDYETHKRTFEDLLAKTESARTAVNLENRQVGEQFRVLDPPRVPVTPVSPNRLMITGIGLIGGLALGVLFVAGLELRDGSFKSETEIEQVLSLPVIALVPNVVTEGDKTTRRMRRLLAATVAVAIVGTAGYVVWTLRLWAFVA